MAAFSRVREVTGGNAVPFAAVSAVTDDRETHFGIHLTIIAFDLTHIAIGHYWRCYDSQTCSAPVAVRWLNPTTNSALSAEGRKIAELC
jgi:hypothetical protein